MAWNRGSQGVSPKKNPRKTPKTKKRRAAKAVMLASRKKKTAKRS
jgi:hypothetical protein